MGNRQNCAKFQENLFRSNEIILIFCPPLFRKRPIHLSSKLYNIKNLKNSGKHYMAPSKPPHLDLRCLQIKLFSIFGTLRL